MKIISFTKKHRKPKPLDLTKSYRELYGEDHEPVIIEPDKEIWFKIVVDISEEMKDSDYNSYIKPQLDHYSIDHPKTTVILDLPGYLAAQEKNEVIWDEFFNSPFPEKGGKRFPGNLYTDPFLVKAYQLHNDELNFIRVESEGIISHENFVDDTKPVRALLRELRNCTDYHQMIRLLNALDIFWS